MSRSRSPRRTGAAPLATPGRSPASAGRGRPRLTSRAAVLVLVLAVLAVSYASSLRAYLEQRHHLSSLEGRIADSERTIAALEREKKRWRDPAFVISQARARFAFGMPGEIGYRVLDESGEPLDQEQSLSEPAPTDALEPEWWQTTLTSIEVAGDPPEDHQPEERITAPPPEQERAD